ncbi:hypothetical protein RRF57_000994 [Xylaria bambusicola]|uniref:Uncharacterized protein n=1 Tax=Xylaria bambusicola TaxID=326684 RepID=A0AAN7UBS3_9PEZI
MPVCAYRQRFGSSGPSLLLPNVAGSSQTPPGPQSGVELPIDPGTQGEWPARGERHGRVVQPAVKLDHIESFQKTGWKAGVTGRAANDQVSEQGLAHCMGWPRPCRVSSCTTFPYCVD